MASSLEIGNLDNTGLSLFIVIALILAVYHIAWSKYAPRNSVPYPLSIASALSALRAILGVKIDLSVAFWLALLCRMPELASGPVLFVPSASSDYPKVLGQGIPDEVILWMVYQVCWPPPIGPFNLSFLVSRIIRAFMCCIPWTASLSIAIAAGELCPEAIVWYHRLPSYIYISSIQLIKRLEVLYPTVSYETEDRVRPFVYDEQLSKYEIRLIELDHRRFGKPPRCRFVRNALNIVPDFVACSYVWGDATPRRSLLVRNASGEMTQLRITQSAYDVIDREQSFFKSKLIWIDAVCINQDDPKEKSRQVAIMTSIFTRASIVKAYLDASLRASNLPLWVWASSKMISKDIPINEIPQVSGHFFGVLTDFFSCPWFQRAWVVQEAVVARKILLIYRGATLSWDVFDRLLTIYTRIQPVDSESGIVPERPKMRLMKAHISRQAPQAYHLNKLHQRWRTEFAEMPLVDLLFNGRLVQATNPRDKIYAYLGIAEPNYNLPISYHMSVREVYTRTMRCIFARSGNHKALKYAGIVSAGRIDSLPSWVAAWSDQGPSPLKHQFDAQSFKIPNPQDLSQTSMFELMIAIRVVDSVGFLADPLDFDYSLRLSDQPLQDKLQQLWAFAVQNTPRSSTSLSVLREAFWKSVVCGFVELKFKAILDEREDAEIFRVIDKYFSVTVETDVLIGDFVSIEDSRTIRRGADYINALVTCMRTEIRRTFCERRLGMTVSGKLGVFPNSTRIGDSVVILSDANNYSVLRRYDESFTNEDVTPTYEITTPITTSRSQHKLVGQCYVASSPAEYGVQPKESWIDWKLV